MLVDCGCRSEKKSSIDSTVLQIVKLYTVVNEKVFFSKKAEVAECSPSSE